MFLFASLNNYFGLLLKAIFLNLKKFLEKCLLRIPFTTEELIRKLVTNNFNEIQYFLQKIRLNIDKYLDTL